MKLIKTLVATTLCLSATSIATAQDLNTAYFFQGNTFGHQLNPAYINERGYVTIPVLPGNLSVTTRGNVGLDNFLYKYGKNGYDLTTFMSPTVSEADFLSNIHDANKISFSARYSLLGVGFHGFGGFNTIELGVRAQGNVLLPGDLFRFMKSGMTQAAGTQYDFSGLHLSAQAFTELAFGHARQLNENWQVGGKLKVLIGGANAVLDMKRMKVEMSDKEWKLQTEGEGNVAAGSAYFEYKKPTASHPNPAPNEIKTVKMDKFSMSGFGLGVDMGAIYKAEFLDGLTLSASLNDVGFISWNNNITATSQHEYTFKGFSQPVTTKENDKNDPNSVRSQVDQIKEDLKGFVKFYDTGAKKSRSTGLGATFRMGGAYTLPAHKQLTFGLLSTSYFHPAFSATELRASANYTLAKWVELGLSYGFGSYGGTMGWAVNFHPAGFNFFVAGEHNLKGITPQGVPVGRPNYGINLGMNITLGKSKAAKK